MAETKPRFATDSHVSPIPKGFHSVTPYLSIKGAQSGYPIFINVLLELKYGIKWKGSKATAR